MTLTPRPHLCITSDIGTHSAKLMLDGELDYETTPALDAAVRDLLSARPDLRELHLDCARIRFCDTVGLAGLLGVRRGSDSARVTLLLDNRSSTLDRLLELTGILDHLTSPLTAASPHTLGTSTGYGSADKARSSRPG
jgi:anti-anti-sigma factor